MINKPRVVVSGANGFVGQHLVNELFNNDVNVIGVGYDKHPPVAIESLVERYYAADLTEEWPDIPDVDAVIHLAGLAAVGPSFDNPQRYINANSAMVTNLCEYYQGQNKKPRIVVVSSGAVYDNNQPMPIDESGTIGLNSPYVISKILTENQCAYYQNRGLECVVVRPFNHVGPGQAPGFIIPDFHQRISALNENEAVISVGNIDTKRDYTDVRDIARAYRMIALAPSLQHNLYNACSGNSLSGRQILDRLKLNMARNDLSFEVDPSLVRPTDIPEIVGNADRLKQEFGWSPEIPIEQSISDFILEQNRDR